MSVLCPNIHAEKQRFWSCIKRIQPRKTHITPSHLLTSTLQDTFSSCFNTQNTPRAQDAAFCLLRESQHWLRHGCFLVAQGNQRNTSPLRTSSRCHTHREKLTDFSCSNSLHPARICNLQRHIFQKSTQNKFKNLEGAARKLLTLRRGLF